MKRFSILLNLAVAVILVGIGGGSVWAQDVLQITPGTPQVTQDFDGMWNGDLQEATLNMPQGWRVERQMGAPRTVGSYSSATATVMYTGGTSLATSGILAAHA